MLQHGEAWAYATLHALSIGAGRSEKRIVELRIDGRPIGVLTPAMSAHYIPALDHLTASGCGTAAKVLLRESSIQVEAVLYAARGHELDASWLAEGRSSTQGAGLRKPPHETNGPPSLQAAGSVAERASVLIPPKPTVAFRVPPGWPPPPEGWEPFPGWQPDPSWPAPPEGWVFWATE